MRTQKLDEYEIFHKLDRYHQAETAVELLEALADDDIQVIIAEGGTGSGKTAWIAEISKYYRTIAIPFTKSLQKQYEKYGFEPLYGLGNYLCGKQRKITAATCGDMNDGLRPCVERDGNGRIINSYGCPYAIAKDKFLGSVRGTINMAKYLADTTLMDSFAPEVLVVDEAHILSDFLIDYGGATLRWKTPFYSVDPVEFVGVGKHTEATRTLLSEMIVQMNDNRPPKPLNSSDKYLLRENGAWIKVMGQLEFLSRNVDDEYFIEATKEGLTIKPLTPVRLFKKRFLNRVKKIILMSATPGNPKMMAQSLGVANGAWVHVEGKVKHPLRVKALNAPRMTGLFVPRYGKNREAKVLEVEQKRAKHAKVIADEINSYPVWYRGLISATNYDMCHDIAKRLGSQGINCYVPERGIGTEAQVSRAIEAISMKNSAGSYVYRAIVSCTFNEGVDLGMLNFVIVGKIPFPFTGDAHSKARREADKLWYMMTTANKTRQILGRACREEKHFLPDADKVVCICDSSYTGILPYCPPSFTDNIVLSDSNIAIPKKGRKLRIKKN